MNKYRVELDNYKVKNVTQTDSDISEGDAVLEEHTGETIFAIIHAADDAEAKQKAEQLAKHLKTKSLE